MASVCLSNAGDDTRRLTYVELHRWPESEAEFVKRVSYNKGSIPGSPTRVVDSISCRQVYLRSYTFSRKEEGVKDKTLKCLGKLKQRVVVCATNVSNLNLKDRFRIELFMLTRAKNASCAAFFSVFHRLLSCSSNKVDVSNLYAQDF
ncbi:uncharacterized protein G2W53_037687 [Senna tora]|uniref:Uncharacterized protein n=1 Tax=Senna tora TaxID=362788 RepID=A0A834SLE1_9FABA|nr:uncharacterized protein G2W53_037687 [Senna tora]